MHSDQRPNVLKAHSHYTETARGTERVTDRASECSATWPTTQPLNSRVSLACVDRDLIKELPQQPPPTSEVQLFQAALVPAELFGDLGPSAG